MGRADTDPNPKIESLVQGFARHIKALKAPETKEAQVRQNYIDPFWRELGWDVGDSEQRGPTEADVVIENNVETTEITGTHNRAVDYLFRLNGFPRFVVEAKKPLLDIDTDKDAIFQAKRYAWNKNIPFAVLTDFEQFRLYDCTLKPIYKEPHRGLIKDFSIDYGSYPAQWDVLLSTFGRQAVADGSLEKLLATIKKLKAGRRVRTVDRMLIDIKGGEPVDQVFLDYLHTHRKHFAADIYRHNKKAFPDADTLHGAARLTEAVQRIMDRLVFVRVCEDRDIIRFGSLRETLERIGTEGGDLYESLIAEFRDLDNQYNGYLFKPHFSEELKVDGGVLSDFIRDLYPPDGPWDFAAIGDDILGIVYERFLGNVVTVRKHLATIEEKPEVRHAGGVYYTPRFVVDTIIRRVVQPKLAGKSPAEVLSVKILDPACGSGSFLVAALQYLFDHCLRAVESDNSLAKIPFVGKGRKKKSDVAFRDGTGRWFLAPDFRAAVLTNCIHGVDIDQQAVEVTVMSLYLKMLEGKLPDKWQHDWLERQLLPPLENNIHCGNSLIDEQDYDAFLLTRRGSLFGEDVDTKFRINRFDWTSRTRGFGRLLDKNAVKERGRSGFDCIIGNPPYIRVQELNKWAPEECEFYKWKYKSAARGNYDIYVVFTEKAFSLLTNDGLLGFIMPHKFLNKQYAEGFRGLVADLRAVRELIHFQSHQVFQGVTTYTAILVLQAHPNDAEVRFVTIERLDDGEATMRKLLEHPNGLENWFRVSGFPHPLSNKPWSFSTSPIIAQLADLPRLDSVADIFVGIQTDADDVYYLKLEERYSSHRITSALCTYTGTVHEIETEILRPLATGTTAKRFLLEEPEFAAIFPFEPDQKEHWKPMSQARIRADFPLAYSFLTGKEVRSRLEGRAKGKLRNSGVFWDFIYRKNLAKQNLAKVCVPRLAERLTACLDKGDDSHRYCLDNVDVCGVIPTDVRLTLDYLVGLLNSKLLDYFMRNSVRDSFRGGYLSLNKQYIAPLPIKIPEAPEERRLASRITECVRAIMEVKTKLRAAKLSDRETKSLESDVEANERRIDEAVFALYGVKGLPE